MNVGGGTNEDADPARAVYDASMYNYKYSCVSTTNDCYVEIPSLVVDSNEASDAPGSTTAPRRTARGAKGARRFGVAARAFDMASPTPELLVEAAGSVRVVTLNRPAKLNVLSLEMVDGLHALWSSWAADPEVLCVVLRGASGARPCLCAGGDVRAVHDARPPPGDPLRGSDTFLASALEFFEREYAMNALLAESPLAHVAVMDGIVMGGGCGVSVHGAFRVATERTALAMPETLIGFVPDVGGTRFLADAPGELGTLLALTGHTIDGEDAKACGLATHVVDAATLPALVPELVKALEPLARCGERSRSDVGERTHHPSDDEDDVDDDDDDVRDPRREAARDAVRAVLSRLESASDATRRRLKVDVDESESERHAVDDAARSRATNENVKNRALRARRADVDVWFGGADASSIESRLSRAVAADPRDALAAECLAALRAASPASVAVALAMVRAARREKRTLRECLAAELRAAAARLAGEDFFEGVRAKLIDKGRGEAPRWEPLDDERRLRGVLEAHADETLAGAAARDAAKRLEAAFARLDDARRARRRRRGRGPRL